MNLKACRMMDYFIHQKKCMAERKTDEDIDQLKQRFAEEDQKLEQQSALDGQIEQRKSQKEKKSKISPYEKLLLAPGDRIAWNYLLHHHGGFDTEQLNMAAKELEKKILDTDDIQEDEVEQMDVVEKDNIPQSNSNTRSESSKRMAPKPLIPQSPQTLPMKTQQTYDPQTITSSHDNQPQTGGNLQRPPVRGNLHWSPSQTHSKIQHSQTDENVPDLQAAAATRP
ncbi:unnamed protein product, partial [Didymodactylos carnosus]